MNAKTIFLFIYFEIQSSFKYYFKGLIVLLHLIGLKFLLSLADIDDLQYFLFPTVKLTQLFTGLSFHWVDNEGFYNPSHQILINRACAGTNFLILTLGILLYKNRGSSFGIPLIIYLLCATISCAVLVNFCRIYISLALMPAFQKWNLLTENMHLFTGGLIYVFSLLIIHSFFPKLYR